MNEEIEILKSFNRVSKLLEFTLDQFELSELIKTLAINELWKDKALCLRIDKMVREIWKM